MLVIKMLMLMWLVSGVCTALVGLFWACKKSAEMLGSGEE